MESLSRLYLMQQNLVLGDTNKRADVFVRDIQTGKIELASISSDGTQANLDCGGHLEISADGRFVAFESAANNLVNDDTNGGDYSSTQKTGIDIFVHDMQTGETKRVSISNDGVQANWDCEYPSISADGRFVAFSSRADNLVPDDTNLGDSINHYSGMDVFVYDMQASKIERVSISSDGAQGDWGSCCPSISADGRYVAFQSSAENLVPADINGVWDAFIHDRQTGVTKIASISSEGKYTNGDSYCPLISADGRYVAFFSDANNLVSGDTNNTLDVFVHDMYSPVTSVTLNNTILSLNEGVSETLVATISPTDATNLEITWSSSDTSVATVDSSGSVTAVLKGTAIITVTTVDGSKTATCLVNVIIPVTGVTINKTILDLNKSAEETLVAAISPGDASNKAVAWSSSNTSVAAIDTNGKVTAVGGGISIITVTTADGSKTATCQVNVYSQVTGVTLNKTTLSVSKGDTETLEVALSPDDANNKTVTWSSSNSSIASVDSSGKVTAVEKGDCTITVRSIDSGQTATCQVNVIIPVTGVTLNKTILSFDKGNTETLTATILPADASSQAVTWSSSNNTIVSVDAGGKVTALGGGSCTITVTTVDGSKTADCKVDVNVPVTGVALNKTTLPLNKGFSETLAAIISPGDASNKAIAWSSSNTGVATVDTNGKVAAVSVERAQLL